jgi:hypothetical protein
MASPRAIDAACANASLSRLIKLELSIFVPQTLRIAGRYYHQKSFQYVNAEILLKGEGTLHL